MQATIYRIGLTEVDPTRFGLTVDPPLFNTEKRHATLTSLTRAGRTITEWITTHERTQPYIRFDLYDGIKHVMTGYMIQTTRVEINAAEWRILQTWGFDERLTLRISRIGYGQWVDYVEPPQEI